ncbi:response regulator transcription factor [Longibaculum muris]|uniref:response regulator transcription factor n=1 Tax=Longibaculum muris TaxID=1796628 RepID=UPI0022E6ED24|nr:response regulator [Longibaculum muris]
MENLCKILVVDDEFIIRQGIIHFVDWKKEGFEIIGEASNGKEALEIIEKMKPHIILCDIVMPVMDGIELSEVIKNQYPDIKIIVLSSYSDFDNVKKMFLNGASDYILKPTLNQKTLMDSLHKVVKQMKDVSIETKQELSLTDYLSQLMSGFHVSQSLNHPFLKQTYFYLLAISCKGDIKKQDIKKTLENNINSYHQENVYLLKSSDDVLVMILGFKYLPEIENLAHKFFMKNIDYHYFVLSDYFCDISLLQSIYQNQILSSLKKTFYLKDEYLMTSQNIPQTIEPLKFDVHEYSEYLYMMKLYEAIDLLKHYTKTSLLKHVDEQSLKSIVDNYQIELNQDVMKQIIQYLYKHYQEPLTLYDLADYFNFNYSYLSSYFNERSDLSFNECLNKIRIQKAAEMLQDKQYNIQEIGQMVGFSDHSYFCKVFKKLMNVTPSQYRKGLMKK